MSDIDATPSPFDQNTELNIFNKNKSAEELERKLAQLALKSVTGFFKPAARVADLHMSRYTIEWTGSPLSEGTVLYALQESSDD